MELCQVVCGDAVRPCLRGCFYEDMQLTSGSNDIGLKIQEVVLNTFTPHVFHALATQDYGFEGSNDVRA